MAATATTEETVRDVLGLTYDRFGFQDATVLIDGIVELLGHPSMAVVEGDSKDDASEAAETVRDLLWKYYTGGGASASATCNLFFTLNREVELGWILDEAHYTEWDINHLQDRLAQRRDAKS